MCQHLLKHSIKFYENEIKVLCAPPNIVRATLAALKLFEINILTLIMLTGVDQVCSFKHLVRLIFLKTLGFKSNLISC